MHNMNSNFKILWAKRSNWASKQGKIIMRWPVFVQALLKYLYNTRELYGTMQAVLHGNRGSKNQQKKKTIDLCPTADILS